MVLESQKTKQWLREQGHRTWDGTWDRTWDGTRDGQWITENGAEVQWSGVRHRGLLRGREDMKLRPRAAVKMCLKSSLPKPVQPCRLGPIFLARHTAVTWVAPDVKKGGSGTWPAGQWFYPTSPRPQPPACIPKEKNHRVEHFQVRFAGWDSFKGGLRDHLSALLLAKESKEAKRSKSYFIFLSRHFYFRNLGKWTYRKNSFDFEKHAYV